MLGQEGFLQVEGHHGFRRADQAGDGAAGAGFLRPVLYQLYGQTESVPVAGMGPSEWFADVPGSDPLLAVGKVMPYSGIEIRDDDNRPLPAGEVGEIALMCEGQVTEILNEPELTRERLVDGWVLSGDVGKIDANGYVYLTDRKDDMIISGGFNIWPAELENVISSLDGVREVAVVAAPHERWGEIPVAVVVSERRRVTFRRRDHRSLQGRTGFLQEAGTGHPAEGPPAAHAGWQDPAKSGSGTVLG